MNELIVADVEKTRSMFLHASTRKESQLEFHQRIFACWLYAIMFTYLCVRGYESRLLFNMKFVTTYIDENIPPGTTNNAYSYDCERVELLWSNIDNFFIRIIISPLYGFYIIFHTLIGSNVHFAYSKENNGFLTKDQYDYKNNEVFVTEKLK